MTHQHIEQFRVAMVGRGLLPPAEIIADGCIHRCDTQERNGKGDGSYLLHLDGIPAGGFQNHQDGIGWENWRADIGRQLTRAEVAEQRRVVEAAKRQRQEDQARRYADGKAEAQRIFELASEDECHPYLVAKCVGAHGARVLTSKGTDWLLVPMFKDGEIVNLQRIPPDGQNKRPLTGAEKPGCYFCFGEMESPERIIIAEGFSTSASIFECTGLFTVCAFDSGNLSHVAQAMRDRYPGAQIVFAADDDWLKDNTGEVAARKAAALVSGGVILPVFGAGRAEGHTDFNDLMIAKGIDEVRAQIEAGLASLDAQKRATGSFQSVGLDGVQQDDWTAPMPIPDDLLPVEVFNPALLPESLRGWVVDIADRMQCPPDFPAVGAMVAMSSVVGRKACIQPKQHDDWRVIPNLWGAIVGRPGVMKSPALAEALRPLDTLSAKANESFTEAMRDFETTQTVIALSKTKAEKDASKYVSKGDVDSAKRVLMAADVEGDAKPVLRRYKVNDSSVEKLGEILIDNPFGTLVYRDELSGLLRSMDKEGQEGARSFYLQGYDGNQDYTFDRIIRGGNLRIPAVCVSMLGGIQPSKLRGYIRDAIHGGTGDDGLLQRFGLLVQPDISANWKDVDRFPDTPARQAAMTVFNDLDAIEPVVDSESGEAHPRIYRFTEEAQEAFKQYRHEFETALRSGEHHPALESHLAKYRKLVPAIALLCALADGEHEVGKQSLLRALAWAEYLQSHAERIYASATRPAAEGAKALLSKIKSGHVVDNFKPADVYLKGWAHLSSTEEAHAAISLLCDLGYLRKVTTEAGEKGGRRSTTVQINPDLLGGD